MKQKLNQLKKEINKIIARKKAEPPPYDNQDFDLHFDECDRNTSYQIPEIPVAEITGLAVDKLPCTNKLKDSQKANLSIQLQKLLLYCNFILEFPQNYPHKLRYAFIRNFWAGNEVPLKFATVHVELCSYDKNNCPFEGYCSVCFDLDD